MDEDDFEFDDGEFDDDFDDFFDEFDGIDRDVEE